MPTLRHNFEKGKEKYWVRAAMVRNLPEQSTTAPRLMLCASPHTALPASKDGLGRKMVLRQTVTADKEKPNDMIMYQLENIKHLTPQQGDPHDSKQATNGVGHASRHFIKGL